MRIFVQYSVSGFKIFDTSRFTHPIDGGRYCTMKEISETNKGGIAGTHIINSDLHGLSHGVVQLFTSPLVDMLLQTTIFEEQEQIMLFINHVGISVNQKRDCNIVVLLVSEHGNEKALLSKMALLLLSEKRNSLLTFLSELLDKRLFGEEFVLFYNEDGWQSVITFVNENAASCDVTDGSGFSQLLLPAQGKDAREIFQKLSCVFNKKPYHILHGIKTPFEKLPQKTLATTLSNAETSDHYGRLSKLLKTIIKDIITK